MTPAEHHIKVSRSARYFTLGEPGPHVRQFIFCLHGYGQLAGQFIHKFTSVYGPEHYVVAPEGLSRFYLDGTFGAIGATWMTREDRLHEIEDYCHFLSSLHEPVTRLLPKDAKVVLFGFSQGCATLSRWVAKAQPHFDHLILWGGAFADDLDYRSLKDYLADKKITVVLGDNDPYISKEAAAKHRAFTDAQGLKYDFVEYAGGHEIDREVLKRVVL